MSIERDVAELLADLRGHHTGLGGSSISARFGDGIRNSGIVDQLRAGNDAVSQNMMQVVALASVIGAGIRDISRELRTTNQLLAGLDDMLRNPLATSADELYRRGCFALENGWLDEAVLDLGRALDANPYSASARAAMAVALVTKDDLVGAAEQYRLAYRYALPLRPGTAMGFASLAATSMEQAGDVDGALAFLRSVLETGPFCPDLDVQRARLAHDGRGIARGFEAAPDLARIAVELDLPGVESSVDAAVASPEGPVARAKQAVKIIESLNDTWGAARIRFDPPRLDGDPLDVLEAAGATLDLIAEIAAGLDSTVRRLAAAGVEQGEVVELARTLARLTETAPPSVRAWDRPAKTVPAEVVIGSEYVGVVVKVATFGLFVEIANGRDGLLHVSELKPLFLDQRVPDNLAAAFPVGDILQVRVETINDRGAIGLGLSPLELERVSHFR